MTNWRSKVAKTAGATALALTGFASTALAETITLKMSNYLPPKHGFTSDFMAPFAKELEERTNGKVKVELLDATSAFGKLERQADQVRAGVVDIALGLNGIPRDRFQASSIIELPFLVETSAAGSHALWTLYKEGLLGDEYDDFKVLALFVHNGGLFHTAIYPVKVPGDLKGLRLRTPSPAVSAMLQQLDASPVGLPPAAIYESLQKGSLDGVVTTWDLVGAIKLNEIMRHHTDARAYVAGFHVVMNKKSYEALPDDVREVLDDMTGDNLVAKFGAWWDAWDARGKEDAIARGHDIVVLSDEERDAWFDTLEPMVDGYLDRLERGGIENAREIYARAKELIAEHNGTSN